MIRTALCVVVASGFLAVAAFAQEVTGMMLEDSGFKMREANTAKKMERLRSLPARKFVRRTRKGAVYFVYADPDYCKCAYIGNQQAMNNFRGMTAPVSGLPGYTGPIDTSKPTGDNVASDMMTDMGEDGDISGQAGEDDDDIFNPSAMITIPIPLPKQ